jgi:hypothetical protein
VINWYSPGFLLVILRLSMEKLNLYGAWVAILMGFLLGVLQGLFFHNENWLGGYTSWTRRLMRLGHISFFGLALINLAFVFSMAYLKLNESKLINTTSISLLVALITMPISCYVCAFNKRLRFLFVVPIASVILGTIVFLVAMTT